LLFILASGGRQSKEIGRRPGLSRHEDRLGAFRALDFLAGQLRRDIGNAWLRVVGTDKEAIAFARHLAVFDSPKSAFTHEWTLVFGTAIGIIGVAKRQTPICCARRSHRHVRASQCRLRTSVRNTCEATILRSTWWMNQQSWLAVQDVVTGTQTVAAIACQESVKNPVETRSFRGTRRLACPFDVDANHYVTIVKKMVQKVLA
jgi:hypothetical protein